MKLVSKQQTDQTWLMDPYIVASITPSKMWKPFTRLIALSTWIRTDAISCVSTTSAGRRLLRSLRNGGMFNFSPRASSKSKIVKPLSAIMLSPLSYGNSSTPDLSVSSLSLMDPVYNCDTKQTASVGEIPISPFSVFLCLYDENDMDCLHREEGISMVISVASSMILVSGYKVLKQLAIFSLTTSLLGKIFRLPSLRNKKFTKVMITVLIVLCDKPYKCANVDSAIPRLSLTRVINNASCKSNALGRPAEDFGLLLLQAPLKYKS